MEETGQEVFSLVLMPAVPSLRVLAALKLALAIVCAAMTVLVVAVESEGGVVFLLLRLPDFLRVLNRQENIGILKCGIVGDGGEAASSPYFMSGWPFYMFLARTS